MDGAPRTEQDPTGAVWQSKWDERTKIEENRRAAVSPEIRLAELGWSSAICPLTSNQFYYRMADKPVTAGNISLLCSYFFDHGLATWSNPLASAGEEDGPAAKKAKTVSMRKG